MAREIETITKLKGVEAKSVSSFFEERLGEIFGKFSASRSSDSWTDYAAGATLKPYGLKARLKIEDIGNNEILVKMSARLKLNMLGIIALIITAVSLLLGLSNLSAIPLLIFPIIFIPSMAFERRRMRKQIMAFFEELKVRFS